MDIIAGILKLIILIGSVIAIFSYSRTNKKANENAALLAKEINDAENNKAEKNSENKIETSSDVEDVIKNDADVDNDVIVDVDAHADIGAKSDPDFANEIEVNALKHIFYLKDIDAPIKKIAMHGEVEVNQITYAGSSTRYTLLIDGISIQVPEKLAMESIIQDNEPLSPPSVALVGEKFYLLSYGDFSLVAELLREKIKVKTEFAVKENQTGKIEALPLEVLSHREPSEHESFYFDRITTGKRYAISIMASLIIAAVILNMAVDGPNSPYIWFATNAAILMGGFALWYRSRKRDRDEFQVIKMKGIFNKVISKGEQSFAQVLIEDDQGNIDFLLPTIWEDKNDRIPLKQNVIFEVQSASANIMTIENTHDLDRDFKTEPTKHFQWAAATFAVLILNMLIYVNINHVNLALNMINNTDIKEVNSVDDWKSINNVGQRIHTSSLHRQCILSNNESSKIEWFEACNQFNVLDKEQNIDLLSSVSQEIKKLRSIDKEISFSNIDTSLYRMLQLQFLYSQQKLAPQNEIFEYDYLDLNKWAQWVNNNNIQNKNLKDKIIIMWKEIDSDNKCKGNCWEKILAYQNKNNAKLEKDYVKESELDRFFQAKSKFLETSLDPVLATWSDKFLSMKANSNAEVTVQFITNNKANNAWESLLYTSKSHNSYYSRKRMNGLKYIKMINSAALAIKSMQRENIEYGIVSSISTIDGKKVIEVDSTMDEALYRLYLAKIAILLMGLLGLGLTLIGFRRQNSKSNKDID